MYCTKCGKELKSTARFCPQCGAAVEQKETGQSTSMASKDSSGKEYQESSEHQSAQTQTDKVKKSGSKKAMVVIGIILFLVIGAGLLLFWYNSPENRLQRQLDLAQRYLLEEDYEQAIVEFEKAIALDPKCVEAYLGAAEAYVALEDYESAVELLEAGYEETQDESLQQELERYLEEGVDDESIDDGSGDLEAAAEGIVETEAVYLLVKEQTFNGDGSVSYWVEYEYDSQGKQIKETWYNEDGSVSFWHEYEYDSQGKQIKETWYAADGSVNSQHEYEYDSQRNQIKETWYAADGSVSHWYEYEYDVQGNQIKETKYVADGSVERWYEYEYDSQGNQIKYTWYAADGSVIHWDEYEYDVQGNQIKETRYAADGSVGYWEEYEYDSQGNLIKETYYREDRSVSYWFWKEYEYDSQGNLIKDTQYNEDGSVSDWQENEYDSQGNLIKETKYNGDGSVNSWTEYEYDVQGSNPEENTEIEQISYYGVWSNYDEAESMAEKLEITFESDEMTGEVSATIAGREYAIGTSFIWEDGTFSCTLIIDAIYNNASAQWEPAYAEAYLNGKLMDENSIECELQYEGSEYISSYYLERVDAPY